jgi:hypothetical protein
MGGDRGFVRHIFGRTSSDIRREEQARNQQDGTTAHRAFCLNCHRGHDLRVRARARPPHARDRDRGPDCVGALASAVAPIPARARDLDSDAGTPVRTPAIEQSTRADCTHHIRGSTCANLLHAQAARADKWVLWKLVAPRSTWAACRRGAADVRCRYSLDRIFLVPPRLTTIRLFPDHPPDRRRR